MGWIRSLTTISGATFFGPHVWDIVKLCLVSVIVISSGKRRDGVVREPCDANDTGMAIEVRDDANRSCCGSAATGKRLRSRTVYCTVRLAVPDTCTPFWLKVAVIMAVPGLAVLARPAVLMVATVALDEVQLTWFVKSTVLPSLNVPTALNCTVAPLVTI